MTGKTLSSRYGTVHYWISRRENPDAACIVFLPGLTADHTLFDRQVDCFARDYTVLTWDAPAHGKSRPYARFTYAHAADMLRAILHAEHIDRCIFAGQSMGGYVIQMLLKRYPQIAQAFIGIDTCPFGMGYYSNSDLWWVEQMEPMCRMFPDAVLRESIARSCTRTPYAHHNMHAALSHYGKDELCSLLGTGYRQFARELCDIHISCPVLLLVGEHDITGKVRQYNFAWQAREGYPLHLIPNAAHNSNADNSARCNQLIRNFIHSL